MIETERLFLRPFMESDAADVLEYLSKPTVNCFASMKLDSLEEAKEEMKRRVGETEYYFAIALKETGKVIGEIEAYPERGEPHDTSSPFDTFSPCWICWKRATFPSSPPWAATAPATPTTSTAIPPLPGLPGR